MQFPSAFDAFCFNEIGWLFGADDDDVGDFISPTNSNY